MPTFFSNDLCQSPFVYSGLRNCKRGKEADVLALQGVFVCNRPDWVSVRVSLPYGTLFRIFDVLSTPITCQGNSHLNTVCCLNNYEDTQSIVAEFKILESVRYPKRDEAPRSITYQLKNLSSKLEIRLISRPYHNSAYVLALKGSSKNFKLTWVDLKKLISCGKKYLLLTP